jgi:cyclic beta-1,2-glucan synthetase
LYRVGLEAILGFHLQGNRLSIEPCIPANWHDYEITYRYRSATYHVTVENHGHGGFGVSVDGKPAMADAIDLVDDGRIHEVLLTRAMEQEPKRGGSAD